MPMNCKREIKLATCCHGDLHGGGHARGSCREAEGLLAAQMHLVSQSPLQLPPAMRTQSDARQVSDAWQDIELQMVGECHVQRPTGNPAQT